MTTSRLMVFAEMEALERREARMMNFMLKAMTDGVKERKCSNERGLPKQRYRDGGS
jgi:hypothetical protein